MSQAQAPELDLAFGRAARTIRARLWLRRALSGAAIGFGIGAAVAAALWWFRWGELRPFAGLLGLLGALAGSWLSARRRWSDEKVALYLDTRLATSEQIVTAVALRGERGEAARHLKLKAAEALSNRAAPVPRVIDALQLLAPLGAAVIVWLSVTPLPAAPKAATPPGAERVQNTAVKGLERIEALRDQPGRNPEDERRLRALADEAKRLRGELAQGMEKREALARMAKLRDAIAELRSEFGNQQHRPGLESAIGALAEHPQLRKAARALGDGDLTEFDREMQRLANQAEREARESAKQALEQAERAAREHGAKNLAEALKQQAEAFEKRRAEAEALRELGKALEGQLDPEALEDLKEFGSSGNSEAARRLAQAMGKALSKLSQEERQRLAERLKQQLANNPGGSSTLTDEELEDLARRLASAEGREELEQRLRELAEPRPTPQAQRDGALDDAERGLGEAERGLGATPLPLPGGPPQPGNAGNPAGGDASNQNNGKPSANKGGGTADHAGKTEAVDAPELRAKAAVRRTGAGPLHAATLGRAPARPGDTANQRGTGSLGSVAPAEIGAVEQSEVPEEYREHVGRYFEP